MPWAQSALTAMTRFLQECRAKPGGRGNRRSAIADQISRGSLDWRMRQRLGIGWHDSGQNPASLMWAFATGTKVALRKHNKGACIVGRRGVGTPPYGCMAGSAVGREDREGRPCRGTRGAGWRADVGISPYGSHDKGAVERVVEDADPYGCMIRGRVRWGRKRTGKLIPEKRSGSGW